MQYTNQKQLRQAFREEFPQLSFKKQRNGDFPCDTRCAFVDWIDHLSKDDQISEKLADRATL
jgi:hypothetical protein